MLLISNLKKIFSFLFIVSPKLRFHKILIIFKRYSVKSRFPDRFIIFAKKLKSVL